MMGYFPNGAAGDYYRSRYCDHCINMRDKNDGRGEGCAIWDLHLLWNYDAVDDKTKRWALDHFIPEEGIEQLECEMFIKQ